MFLHGTHQSVLMSKEVAEALDAPMPVVVVLLVVPLLPLPKQGLQASKACVKRSKPRLNGAVVVRFRALDLMRSWA